MTKVLALAVISGFVLTLSSVADARGGFGGFRGGHGFGGFGSGGFATPGSAFRSHGGSYNAQYPGASYWAPGRQMRMHSGPGHEDSGRYYPGATYWIPGNPGFPSGN